MKHGILFVLGASHTENDGVNSNYFIFTIKDTKLYVFVFTLLAEINQNSKILRKAFESSV